MHDKTIAERTKLKLQADTRAMEHVGLTQRYSNPFV